jgi:hypothetical protein
MNQGFWRGLVGGGDTFWIHRGTLTFRVPAAYHNTTVFQIGVKKIPPNFNTPFGAPICVVWHQRVNTCQKWRRTCDKCGSYDPVHKVLN